MATDRAGGVGLVEVRDKRELVHQSDVGFVQDKLEFVVQALTGQGLGGEAANAQTEEAEHFKTIRLCFDEVIERLPACGSLLAHIKGEYERVIDQLITSRQEATALTHKLHVKATEVATIRNYHHRLKELEVKLANISADNVRIQNTIERMRKERENASKEREHKLEELRRMKPRMTSRKRRALRLSVKEATSVTELQKELQRSRQELEEAREVTQKKYVAAQKKHTLQQRLKENEEVKRGLALTNQSLRSLLQNLKTAMAAAESYRASVRKQEIDSSQLDVADHILTAIGSRPSNAEEISGEESEDPVKEKEAEMILDCFEKFNQLFENEHYEEAALHAASSPKGVLRTLETLWKFKTSARHHPGRRLPLLSYCEALMQSAAAYRQVTPEESMECAKCALEQGEVSTLKHWIVQGHLPSSKELAILIFQHCKCKRRCTCGCKNLALAQFERCGANQQTAICLVHLERFVSFLAFAQKTRFSSKDYASVLYTVPSLEFAKCLVLPPKPFSPYLTVFEGMHLLLRAGGRSKDSVKLLEDYLKEESLEFTQAVIDDVKTSWEVWQSLLACLQQTGLSDLALELFSLLTVKIVLSQAEANLWQELASQPAQGTEKLQDHLESAYSNAPACELLAMNQTMKAAVMIQMDMESDSSEISGSVSGSGYSSSSEDTDDDEPT